MKLWLLLLSVVVIATCGIIYELVAGTLASYLLGDSVLQFSTIIGTYLFSMGVGSYISKYIKNNLLETFVVIEILIGIVGGCSSLLLFYLFNHIESFRFLLYFLVFITGLLVGAEIPLVIRLLQHKLDFSELISRVFSFDYIGALFASIVFPLWFIPQLGIGKTSLIFGMVNLIVAIAVYIKLSENKRKFSLIFAGGFSFAVLLLLFIFSNKIMKISEQEQFGEKIIISASSAYQRIVVTQNQRHTRLFLNGNLQFNSDDEYRYHESLVHPMMSLSASPKKVLVLGGGDGMAVRELLKYPDIESIQLVDLDKKMTQLFTENSKLISLNQGSFKNPKVKVINTDAFQFTKNCSDSFDAICIDFPDPSNYSLGKLYSTSFYKYLKLRLKKNGIAVVQCTSPYAAPRSFWCIDKTLRSVGFNTLPYHVLVPSFGEWGFILFSNEKNKTTANAYPNGLKFLDKQTFTEMQHFPNDMLCKLPIEINQLQNQSLVNYFEEEWSKIQ